MIPSIEVLTEEITEEVYPTKTYKIVLDKGRINGYTDELDAIIQAIYLILSTERYQYIIYSWDYGVELIDLIGKPIPYVMSEIPRRISEALTQDDRIEDVVDFEFEKKGKYLHTTFTVVSTLGELSMSANVNFNDSPSVNKPTEILDTITLIDRSSNIAYNLFIKNGKLMMSEKEMN